MWNYIIGSLLLGWIGFNIFRVIFIYKKKRTVKNFLDIVGPIIIWLALFLSPNMWWFFGMGLAWVYISDKILELTKNKEHDTYES